jgi:aminomethyltransferase
MPLTWRTSALASRHVALGATLEDWNGMGTAWHYSRDTERAKQDYETIRTKAGLMDVSGLKKVHLVGADAAYVIDRVTTRAVDKIKCGSCKYASILNADGKFVDDCIIYHLSVNSWLVVHGTGLGMEHLTTVAAGKNCAVLFDDDLHDMSLQGPLAVDFLEAHVPGIRSLNYFCFREVKLFKKNVMISRTGYTGERGYEIFCSGKDAPVIWDQILALGAAQGITAVQFSTLDWLRVESYLLFYPGDNSETWPFADGAPCGDTIWELGLEFTVSPGKVGFIGAENHYALKGKERFKIYGVQLEGKVCADEGAKLEQDGKEVGVVTYGMYSELNSWNVGIARMPVAAATPGTPLVVLNADGTEIPAVAAEMPFYDKSKAIRMAKG